MINYTDYVDMIKSRANKLSEKYQIPFDELVSEGNLIYCECLNNYDITKASFSTYLYSMLAYGMSDYCRYYQSRRRSDSCFVRFRYALYRMSISSG